MVGIKDLNMPLSCNECRLTYGSDRDWSTHCIFLTDTKDEIVDEVKVNERHINCPLVEIQ